MPTFYLLTSTIAEDDKKIKVEKLWGKSKGNQKQRALSYKKEAEELQNKKDAAISVATTASEDIENKDVGHLFDTVCIAPPKKYKI